MDPIRNSVRDPAAPAQCRGRENLPELPGFPLCRWRWHLWNPSAPGSRPTGGRARAIPDGSFVSAPFRAPGLALLIAGSSLTVAQVAAPPAGDADVLEPVIVVAPIGTTREPDRIPADLQRASAADFESLQALDLTDFMNRSFGSVNINHAQNNPLQPDFNFRGFTASPLLGLPQGLAVYQNGMRANEPFGDTINWDLIQVSAVQEIQLLSGANPVFGLNTLGGALSVRMKDGFTFKGHQGELQGGSFGRVGANAQSGGNDGTRGYYVNADYFEEGGWRDFSASDALRLFGSVGMRTGDSTLDLSAAYASSDLKGNGSAPVELLAEDWSAVFTHPDRTQNELVQVIAEGSRFVGAWRLSGNAYFRSIDTDAVNGDGTIFDECDAGDVEFLCGEDDGELVLDQNGNPIEAELDGEELNAINNISRRRQRSWGASAQASLESQLPGGRRNTLSLGATYASGETSFDAVVEVASLQQDRSTNRTGIFAAGFRTDVDSDNRSWSLYFIDTLDLGEALTLTVSGRYDDTRIRLEDRTGDNPQLNGSHGFSRFNPAAGLTWRVGDLVTAYFGWSQSARAPTPVELACAEEDAPCNLPNAFLADPRLEQVVANSFELGASGSLDAGLHPTGFRWHVGAFATTSRNDILFQTVGGPQANVGFFQNVGDTRRAGLELRIGQSLRRLDWRLAYSYIEATYRDDFLVSSPNHPAFEDDPGSPAIEGDGKLRVRSGDYIPGIPRNQLDAGVDFRVTERVTIGADASYRSGVVLRGDEANLLDRTGDFVVVNLRGEFRASDSVRLFARIENLFDRRYETFGLLGEPDEVLEDFEDPRFLGPAPPFGAWAGVRVRW